MATEPLVVDIPSTPGLSADEKKTDDITTYLTSLITSVRDRRQAIDQQWLLIHHAWAAKRTRFFYTEGTSEHYIPAMRRAVERFVSRCRSQLIPSNEFFEVYPYEEANVEVGKQAEQIQTYLLYLLTVHVKVRAWLDQVIRSYLLYGRAIIKNTIKVIDAHVTVFNAELKRHDTVPIKQVWPTSRVVDPFAFYTWPESATTLDEIQVLFEDVVIPWEEYKTLADRGIVEKLEERDVGKVTWPTTHSIRLSAQGLSDPGTTSRVGHTFVFVSEVWYRKNGRWQSAWIAWNLSGGPKQVRSRPTPDPVPPYRFTFGRQMPGESYTSSVGSDLEPLQVWLNDQVNIAQDGQLTVMSPPVLVNPAAVFRADSLVFRPRAKWIVDPAGIEFPALQDTTRQGLASVQMVLGFMDSFSGSNPLAEGQPTRGMPRAGFAVSSLISLSLSDIKSVAEIIEDDILTPTLSDLHRLAVLFTPRRQRLRIPAVMGMKPTDMRVDALYGDWSFRWVGSVQSQDMQVKAQRLLTMFGLLIKAAPQMQQQGTKVDWTTFVKRMWRGGLGERGADSIIQAMTPEDAMLAMMMQGKLMQQGGQGGGEGGDVAGEAVNAATAESVQRADSRRMTESAVGTMMNGLGAG